MSALLEANAPKHSGFPAVAGLEQVLDTASELVMVTMPETATKLKGSRPYRWCKFLCPPAIKPRVLFSLARPLPEIVYHPQDGGCFEKGAWGTQTKQPDIRQTGAEDGGRTRDIQLGRLALYH